MSEEEPDANGRVLLRPSVPFRTRRAALEQMAAVVRDAPEVSRPKGEIVWSGERRGQDIWQAPEETERLGSGDCEDVEMYAAVADLDDGATDVALCMSVGARKTEHVFGMRDGMVVDHSAAGGMPALPNEVYERRVCVPVRREEGRRAMIEPEDMNTGGIDTGGPSPLDSFDIHGTSHWQSASWDRAASMAAQRHPRAKALYQAVVPGLKSAAAYFSQVQMEAWDRAGNDARLQQVTSQIEQAKLTEDIARTHYVAMGGNEASYVLDFERRYGRPPTDRASLDAAIRALTYIATSKTHPGYEKELAKLLNAEPTSIHRAAIQVAVLAQGLVPRDAYPVPPHCSECAGRRNHGMPPVVKPEEINLNIVYNAPGRGEGQGRRPRTEGDMVSRGRRGAEPAPRSTRPQGQRPSRPYPMTEGGLPITQAPQPAPLPAPPAPTTVAPPPPPQVFAPPPPQVVAPPPTQVFAPPYFTPPPPADAYVQGPYGGYGGAASSLLLSQVPVQPTPVQPVQQVQPVQPISETPNFAGVPLGGAGPTTISNSGNVNLLLICDGGEELFGGLDDGSGGFADPNGLDPTAGMMMGGAGSFTAAMGLSTSGPEGGLETAGPEDEELDTGGFDPSLVMAGGAFSGTLLDGFVPGTDDHDVSTGGFEDDEEEVVTGGFVFEYEDDELNTGGNDESFVSIDDDEHPAPTLGELMITGGPGVAGALIDLGGEHGETLLVDPGEEDCETGQCGLF